jgi:DNA polymerase III delta subunit
MTDRELHQSLKNGELHSQYILVGDEPLLVDRMLQSIKDALKVDESFDVDRFSLSDVAVGDIFNKLFLTPVCSARRLLIVTNLEDLHEHDIDDFADTINNSKSGNCLVMIYMVDKSRKSFESVLKKICAKFPMAECVSAKPNANSIRKWIQSKIRRDQLNLDASMVDYLEEEFKHDITGLKNEFEKIENYLDEAGTISSHDMKDLAKGLCDLDRYQVVNAFLDGRRDTLGMFEELQPYLPTQAVMVDAMTRGVIGRARGKIKVLQAGRVTLQGILEQLIAVDRKIKTGSIFTRLMMELFILHNAGTFRNGAPYGR